MNDLFFALFLFFLSVFAVGDFNQMQSSISIQSTQKNTKTGNKEPRNTRNKKIYGQILVMVFSRAVSIFSQSSMFVFIVVVFFLLLFLVARSDHVQIIHYLLLFLGLFLSFRRFFQCFLNKCSTFSLRFTAFVYLFGD